MLVSDLITAANLVPGTDDVRVKAPLNPALNTILSMATVSGTESIGDGIFSIVLAPISTKFRIRAPFNTALNEMLIGANILAVDIITEAGVSSFQIDT